MFEDHGCSACGRSQDRHLRSFLDGEFTRRSRISLSVLCGSVARRSGKGLVLGAAPRRSQPAPISEGRIHGNETGVPGRTL